MEQTNLKFNLLEKLLKNMTEICLNCKKSYKDHSDSQLSKCSMDIIKAMQKDLKIQQKELDDAINSRKINQ